jgi:hypothetical protein
MLLVGVVAALLCTAMIGLRLDDYSWRASVYSIQERHWRAPFFYPELLSPP